MQCPFGEACLPTRAKGVTSGGTAMLFSARMAMTINGETKATQQRERERETTLTTPRRVRILHTLNFTRNNWTYAASETSPEPLRRGREDRHGGHDTLREVPHRSNEGLALQARVSGPWPHKKESVLQGKLAPWQGVQVQTVVDRV